MTDRFRKIAVLGGGPAGLAIGHYARQSGLDFAIYEAQSRVGGNCVTLRQGSFRFDSGAHRFHDKDPQATRAVRELLGDDLRFIEVPSQIWHDGKMFDFPIAPLDLLRNLGLTRFAAATVSMLCGRLSAGAGGRSFAEFARRTYGGDIASRFLLNYSEKLWGAPCERLSPAICGARLKGFGLLTLLIEAALGRKAGTRHLDGAFYYPRQGYGEIVERIADSCGRQHIHLGRRVSRLVHDGERITAVELSPTEGGQGGIERVAVAHVANTLPLGLTLHLLDPSPPPEILECARGLRYRNVLLVAVFIAKNGITPNGSVYFPDRSFPFTRVYEPRNRSSEMAPPGHTSLVAEIPCQPGDAVWTAPAEALIEQVVEQYIRIGWLERRDVVGGTTHRLHHAYPILELDYERRLQPILDYLQRFANLDLAGRNGCFVYSHLHDMLRHGRELIARLDRPALSRTDAPVPAAPRRRAA